MTCSLKMHIEALKPKKLHSLHKNLSCKNATFYYRNFNQEHFQWQEIWGGGAEGSIDTSPKMLMKTGELDECDDRGGLVGRSQGAVALPVGSVLRGTILNDVTFY